jgi:hypothetical protein
MRYIALAGTILVLAPLAALTLLVEFQPRRPPNVSVSFLGYTNDSTGSRLATFVVKNLEGSSVLVLAPIVSILTPTNEVGRGVAGGMVLVEAHTSRILAVPDPPTTATWRIHLRVTADFGTWREIKSFVMYKLLSVGLKPKYGNMPYSIDGTWIKGDQ